MSSYNQAITLDNNNALAYENRAELYGEQNDLSKAIADFEKAIDDITKSFEIRIKDEYDTYFLEFRKEVDIELSKL